MIAMGFWHGLLIHERVFGAYIACTLIRLWFAAGFFSAHTLFYAGALASVAAAAFVTRGEDSAGTWRIRLGFYPILTVILFVHLRWVSPLINDGKKDAVLWEIDRMLTGGSVSVMLEPLISPLLTEISSFCYMFFMIYIAMGALTYLFSGESLARVFYAGLFSLYGIGYFGYTLVPAVGPYIAYAARFSVPLKGYFMTDFLTSRYAAGTNFTDIFPSLHVAASAFLLFFDMKHNRRRFWLCLIPCVGVWFSTVYLRYHYFTDVAAGFVLAAAALAIAGQARRREERRGWK
jgi:membrane-associated phospholipid phosphatase